MKDMVGNPAVAYVQLLPRALLKMPLPIFATFRYTLNPHLFYVAPKKRGLIATTVIGERNVLAPHGREYEKSAIIKARNVQHIS